MGTIVYYDFTSAESFALSEVAASIQPAPELEWRGIEIEPGVPSPMPPLDRRSQGRIEVEVPGAVWKSESLGIVMPKGRPNTRRALTAVAAVSRMNSVRASALRVALFRAYWRDGEDLSLRGVVQYIADECSVPRWVDLEDVAAAAALASWELDWRTERLGGVPRVIRADGQILWSVKDEASAREFLLGR